MGAIFQQLLKGGQIPWRRNQKNVFYSREHEHAQRIIDHRLVENGKQLL